MLSGLLCIVSYKRATSQDSSFAIQQRYGRLYLLFSHDMLTISSFSGARPLPLWLAYLSFDWFNIVIGSGIMTAILAGATPENWWNIGYLFVVLFLYGLASVLWAYMISLFAKSQLAAFAIAAGSQAQVFPKIVRSLNHLANPL